MTSSLPVGSTIFPDPSTRHGSPHQRVAGLRVDYALIRPISFFFFATKMALFALVWTTVASTTLPFVSIIFFVSIIKYYCFWMQPLSHSKKNVSLLFTTLFTLLFTTPTTLYVSVRGMSGRRPSRNPSAISRIESYPLDLIIVKEEEDIQHVRLVLRRLLEKSLFIKIQKGPRRLLILLHTCHSLRITPECNSIQMPLADTARCLFFFLLLVCLDYSSVPCWIINHLLCWIFRYLLSRTIVPLTAFSILYDPPSLRFLLSFRLLE